MIYKNIDVAIPFKGCKECKRFDIIKARLFGNNELEYSYYTCDNYDQCVNAVAVYLNSKDKVEMEKNEQLDLGNGFKVSTTESTQK